MNTTSRLFAWCFVGTVGLLLGVYLLMSAAGHSEDDKGFHLKTFGQIPILDHGRVKPIDTLARISLMILSGKQDYIQEYKGKESDTQPATRWLLDVMTARVRQRPTEERPVPGDSRLVASYRIEDPAIRAILKLPKSDDKLLSFEDIYLSAGQSGLEQLEKAASGLDPRHLDNLSDRDRELVELVTQLHGHMALGEYETSHRVFRIENFQVLALLGLPQRSGFRYGFDEFLPRLAALEREARRANALKPADRNLFDQKAIDTFGHADLYMGIARGDAKTLHLIAPAERGEEFLTFRQAAAKLQEEKEERSPARLFVSILSSYAQDKPRDFNRFVDAYREDVKKALPEAASKATTEASFNAFAPFKVCMIFYLCLFVVLCISWLWREQPIYSFVFWTTILTVCIHTLALGLRMYIQGRPPVTNLYSSAVFIGWICILVTLLVEWIYRNGIALVVGIITGALTLLIAHHLGGSGDTLEMMQAVLDTNFWLATHVTAVTIGYSATFVAGKFGLVTVLMVVGVTILRRLGYAVELNYTMMKILGQCIYSVVCFAMLFSFLGTVLGGIWADASWGRFWGWDPKENGALLIVIMNAMILHARWAGMIKERGMATLALVGSMVTMWSWFGTNQLGIGLHAYGFNNTLVLVCRYYWLAHLLLIGVALIPFKAWSPTYMPLVRVKEPTIATPTPKKGRPGRGQIMPGGAT